MYATEVCCVFELWVMSKSHATRVWVMFQTSLSLGDVFETSWRCFRDMLKTCPFLCVSVNQLLCVRVGRALMVYAVPNHQPITSNHKLIHHNVCHGNTIPSALGKRGAAVSPLWPHEKPQGLTTTFFICLAVAPSDGSSVSVRVSPIISVCWCSVLSPSWWTKVYAFVCMCWSKASCFYVSSPIPSPLCEVSGWFTDRQMCCLKAAMKWCGFALINAKAFSFISPYRDIALKVATKHVICSTLKYCRKNMVESITSINTSINTSITSYCGYFHWCATSKPHPQSTKTKQD